MGDRLPTLLLSRFKSLVRDVLEAMDPALLSDVRQSVKPSDVSRLSRGSEASLSVKEFEERLLVNLPCITTRCVS